MAIIGVLLRMGMACTSAAATGGPESGGPGSWPYEFRASTFARSEQSAAACAVDSAGRMTVVWSSRRQQEGRCGVYAQRFGPDGVALGAETALSLWGRSHQTAPDIAVGADGTLWVVWQSHGQDGEAGAIIARHFDAAFQGGPEILINEQWRGHQTAPSVVVGPDGRVLFVWSASESSSAPETVWARLFDGGGNPLGGQFPVAADSPGGARTPAAAFAADGSFVIVCAVCDVERRPAGIRMQRFTGDGRAAGAAVDVSGPPNRSEIEPVVAATADGYVVCWLDAESDGDDYGVLARRFDRQGQALCEPFVVNTARAGPQNGAALAVGADGSFVIAWNGRDGDGAGIFARRFTREGHPLGDEFRINRRTCGRQALRAGSATHPLALGGQGQLVCAWSGDAGLGDETSVNITLLTPRPLALSGRTQGVTPDMLPAAPAFALGGGPGPHRPPTFNPADVDHGQRELLSERDRFGFTGIVNTGWTPPDPHLAVGPAHIVVMTNGAIAFFTKDGTLTFQDEIEDSYGFWGSVGASGFVFDPEVLYDELSGRFFAMAAEAWAPPNDTRSYVLVAVSDDSDPNGTWYKYRFNTTALAGELFDSPNIAVDRDAVYITGDGFGLGANYPVFIFDKASLLVGSAPAITHSLTIATATQSAGIPPVTDDSGLLYLIEHAEGLLNTSVRLIALENGLGSPTITTTSLPVPAYTEPEDPPQAGSSIRPETFDARFWSVAYRNGSLWATHHVGSSRVRARWYEIAMNGWPRSGQQPALVQSGEIDPGGAVRTFFPSIAVDAGGSAVLTFSRSAPTEFISMATAYRLPCDPPNTFRPLVFQRQSSAPDTSGRWGDYSAVQPDPVQPRTFWAHHEYTTGSWRTWVARLDLEACPLPGDLDGDGDVDLQDLAILLASYGSDAGGDIDGDGDTDLTDLSMLLANYGT